MFEKNWDLKIVGRQMAPAALGYFIGKALGNKKGANIGMFLGIGAGYFWNMYDIKTYNIKVNTPKEIGCFI